MSDSEISSYVTDEYLIRLGELGEALNSGNHDSANNLIGELTTLRESSLFQELGKLTREIHESINAFSHDERVAELAEEDIPDAKERLNYIVTKTNEAAHRTMEGAESAMDVVNAFNVQADSIKTRWSQFRTKELSKQDFLSLSDDMDKFFLSIDEESNKVKSAMTDIMMAQDYQDLTGQMIKQVITMVQEVEEKLVSLVAISGTTQTKKSEKVVDGSKAHGPQLPTSDKQDVANDQGDVDDLLASLGF